MATQGDIGLDVVLDLVCNDLSVRSFYNENALIVVISDDIRVFEALYSDFDTVMNLSVVHVHHVLWIELLAQDLLCPIHTSPLELVGKGPHRFFLRRHKGIARGLFNLVGVRYKLNVSLLSATNVCDGQICELDSSLTVLLDDVASDVRLALFALDDDTVVATRSHHVLPNFGSAELRALRASDLDAVLVAALDLVLNQVGGVVVDLDTHFIQIELVLNDL